jgi:hypothetical protein
MLGRAIVDLFSVVFMLLRMAIVGFVDLVMILLGPGLTFALVVAVAALWWFGWLHFWPFK